MSPKRLLARIHRGEIKNVDYADFERLVRMLGFELRRTRGSHRVYQHAGIDELLILQPRHDGDAKPYQVRQLVRLVELYALRLEE